jgi:hypothetical protein
MSRHPTAVGGEKTKSSCFIAEFSGFRKKRCETLHYSGSVSLFDFKFLCAVWLYFILLFVSVVKVVM